MKKRSAVFLLVFTLVVAACGSSDGSSGTDVSVSTTGAALPSKGAANADLRGADLSGANLTNANLRGAVR
jgi:uncharacterized protein YjbI with pentapeptide repeats